jgi:hypothetical protein
MPKFDSEHENESQKLLTCYINATVLIHKDHRRIQRRCASSPPSISCLPIVGHLLLDQDEVEKDRLAGEIRDIVGTIVTLGTPLSIISLATLLDIARTTLRAEVNTLTVALLC